MTPFLVPLCYAVHIVTLEVKNGVVAVSLVPRKCSGAAAAA